MAEKNGIVKTWDSLADPSATVFADLRTQVHSHGDRGFLGLAVDPAFPANPYVYVMYGHDAPIGGTAPVYGAPGQGSDDCPSPPAGPGAHGCVASSRISRLRAAGDVMTGPEHVLVEDFCDQFGGHGGGALEFGADGYLYATGGDGASPVFWDYGQDGDPGTEWHPINPCGDPPSGVDGVQSPPRAEGGRLRSQDLRTSGDPLGLNGSLIRIDPATGAGVPGNPMFSHTDPNARRMLAHGFRNAFRMAIRPGTNDVWIGDVGGYGWEELNRMPDPAGPVRNFGWPCYEGAVDAAGMPFANKVLVSDQLNLEICENLFAQAGATTAPYWAYDHFQQIVPGDGCGSGGSVISALAFYPMAGGTFPEAYDGALLFADLARRCVWAMLTGADGLPDPTRIQRLVGDAHYPADLRVGPGGDVFSVNVYEGEVRRLHFTGNPTNRPPTAVAQADPESGAVPLTVDFDGSGSTDPDAGDTLTYEWDLDGDGSFDDSTAIAPDFTYASAGTVIVGLRVTDSAGVSDTATVTVYPGGGPPQVDIAAPAEDTSWAVGDVLSFSGSATDPDDGPLPATALDWELILHHCPAGVCHEHPQQQWHDVATGSFTTPNHTYPSYLELRATAHDSEGNPGTTSRTLLPRTVNLNLQTNPQGMVVIWNDQAAPVSDLAERDRGLGQHARRAVPADARQHDLPIWRLAARGHPDAHAGRPGVHAAHTRHASRRCSRERRSWPSAPRRTRMSTRPLLDPTSAPRSCCGPARRRAQSTEAHMRFLVDGIVGKIQSATLRLRSISDTQDGPAVFRTTAPWSETGVTWANRPPAAGAALADAGPIAAGTITDLDVTSAVTGPGAVSFKLTGTSADAIDLHSREAATPSNSPSLQLTMLNDAYARPRGATPAIVSLVPAYGACTSPNRVHGPPLASGSCAPPAQASSELTVGTPDANGTAANGSGFISYSALVGNPATPADEADVQVGLSLIDVRRRAGLADYAGEVQLVATVRATDKQSSPGGTDPATLTDVALPATVPCAATADTSIGSTCTAYTTIEALLPGAVREGARAIWQLRAMEVTDGGPDGDADTTPNSAFARPGFVRDRALSGGLDYPRYTQVIRPTPITSDSSSDRWDLDCRSRLGAGHATNPVQPRRHDGMRGPKTCPAAASSPPARAAWARSRRREPAAETARSAVRSRRPA